MVVSMWKWLESTFVKQLADTDILEEDPMVTPYAKEVWNEKKIFVNDFIKRYKFDLGIE